MSEKQLQIAIDGPASAGKSTVAKIVAKQLGYIYCDTGAMYRAITYLALRENVGLADETGLVAALKGATIDFTYVGADQHVWLNGEDVTLAIRQPEVTSAVSEVSAHAGVRSELVHRQQEIAGKGGIVMDGRDIGTTVLPQAEVKIFLIASVEERAARRYKENLEKNIPSTLEGLQKDIAKRDHLDSTRPVSPLVKADDAVELDTTGLTIHDVVAEITKLVEKKRAEVCFLA